MNPDLSVLIALIQLWLQERLLNQNAKWNELGRRTGLGTEGQF